MKRMLINSTQPEERRLAIVDGQKLLDYEIEIEGREQRKGNIYKAVVTRVEPSLEACFVDYGEDRHGFLPFKEISKQYFSSGVSVSQARIQDVIREGQELLVQVEKEERGNKGAALTTFVSLAGRYVVLMPNNPRGGGVSRRIEGDDRAELKEALDQLEYPNGMSIIARTAGIGRSAPELQWDLNYLLKLWTAIDGAAKGGKGAFLIYQESSLVIRAIRDYFNNDVGDILIDTDDIYEQARQFMAHVMPEHEGRVKRYRDDAALFSRFQIEHQIASAYSRTVTLPSGGAIVIDQTEALVSVDVNSARAIKGGDIEETATRTNLEAADEVARQARLRDLGGLIVIDFIDMEESRNRRDVENRLRDALRQDRARVQFGTISKFGLMEMSRQRLRPTLSEGASIPCPRCGGSGHIRDTESSALEILRIIQEESMKDNTAALHVQVPVDVASFLLNEKRNEISKIELKQRINVLMVPNKALETPNYKLERMKHDDPRLDNMEASYKMAEEVEDATTVTRRSQEPTNKQTPIIKGVLPDAPAPAALPKPVAPVPVVATNNVAAHAAKSPANSPKPVQKPASKGFVAWIKGLFGGEAAPSAPATPAVAAPIGEAKRDERRDGRREGGRDGAREGGRDGNREGRRDGRGRGRGGERGEREGQRDGQRNEVRGEQREGQRIEQRGEQREGQRIEQRGEQREGQRPEQRGERAERGERRGDGRRGERRGQEPREPQTNGMEAQAAVAEVPAINADAGAPSTNGGERRERGERGGRGRGERGGRGRGERSERGEERRDEASSDATNTGALAVAAGAGIAVTALAANAGGAQATPAQVSERDEGNMERAPQEDGTQGESRDGRERRSRDRYGRDRRERAPRDGQGAEPQQPETQSYQQNLPLAGENTAQAATNYVAPSVPAATPVAMPAAMPVAAPAAAQAQASVAQAMPKVQSYALPLLDLAQVASNSGLEWVNSDAAKIAAVQAAIAAEPKPIRIPRERPAPVVIDAGPLVLVETKRDLRNMVLPFEADAAAQAQAQQQ
jgi:ribonuclease E